MKEENKENSAKVNGISLPISTKQAIEICSFIRGMNPDYAKKLLEEVVQKNVAVPYRRFNKGVGHKTKIGPGRYPVNAAKEFIKLIDSASANAQFKGLNTSSLIISRACANKAGNFWHFGRKRRRKMKRTHVEIFVEERKTRAETKNAEPKAKEKKRAER